MPIKEIMAFAAAAFGAVAVTHPLSWRAGILKIEVSILHEVGDTRSWGDPSLWHLRIPRADKTGVRHAQ